MTHTKDDKESPSQAVGTTSEDGSVNTPDVSPPASSEPLRATGPSTTTGPATAPTPPFGISMVHGPPIVLGLSAEPSISSRQSSRALSSSPYAEGSLLAQVKASITALTGGSPTTGSPYSRPTTPGTLGRFGSYSRTTQSLMQRNDLDGETNSNDSAYSLEREVKHYVERRDSAIYDFYPGAERDQYNYFEERTDMYTTNLFEATAHLIKGSFGVAVLSMHEAYMIGGLWTSLVVTVVIGVLIGYTMFMLIRSAHKMYRRLRINKLSYPDLAEAAAATAPWTWVRRKSKAFRYTVEIILLVQMCGICCIYHIVIAHSIRQIVDSFKLDVLEWLFDIRMYILITIPLLLPLCLIRSIKLMAPFAMVADVIVALCVFATMYFSITLAIGVTLEERAAWKDLHGFIRICGLSMYGTSGICVALPVENNMKKPKYFPRVVRFATAIVILLTTITGVFGYWAWGEQCRSPITVHMPPNIYTTVLQFLMVMMLTTTYAVNFWVPFRIVRHYIMRKPNRKAAFWERLYRFLMAIIIMCTAMIAPHTIPVMIFIGQFFLGFVALVFPAFIEFFVDWEEQYASRASKLYFLIATTWESFKSRVNRLFLGIASSSTTSLLTIRVRYYHNTKNIGLVVLGLILSGSTVYSVRDSN